MSPYSYVVGSTMAHETKGIVSRVVIEQESFDNRAEGGYTQYLHQSIPHYYICNLYKASFMH